MKHVRRPWTGEVDLDVRPTEGRVSSSTTIVDTAQTRDREEMSLRVMGRSPTVVVVAILSGTNDRARQKGSQLSSLHPVSDTQPPPLQT